MPTSTMALNPVMMKMPIDACMIVMSEWPQMSSGRLPNAPIVYTERQADKKLIIEIK